VQIQKQKELEVKQKEKEKEEQDKAKQKEKEAALKEKEKLQKDKEKEKQIVVKQKEAEAKQREKEKLAKQKEKEKEQKIKDKEKEKKDKEKAIIQKKKAEAAARPKRAKSPFMFFVTDNYAKVQDSLKLDDKMNKAVATTKHLAEMWKGLSNEEKAIYIEKAEGDKKRKFDELEAYKLTLPPPKPATAYILYSNAVREEVKTANPNIPLTERSKIIGQMWKNLSEAERNRFNKDAHDKYSEYVKKKAAWQKEHGKTEQKMDDLD